MRLHIINFLESIHSCVMCMNIEITSIIFEICIVPEPATSLLLARDDSWPVTPATEDYLLCHTGTLALRVHVVMPGRLHQTFVCCVCILVCRGSTGYMGCRALWEIVVSAE